MKNKMIGWAVHVLLGVSSVSAFAHGGHDMSESASHLGTVSFKTSCSESAQHEFERGLSLLHSFYYPESVKSFSQVVTLDPSCAIGYWGIAISQLPNPLVGPWDAATMQRGLDAVNAGKALHTGTQREHDWLSALEPFFKNYQTVDQVTRTKRYEHAMAALAKKYPQDVEAKIFHALALIETFDHKSMKPLVKAIDILEPLNERYPDHPGITHYLIHAYDFPPLAKRGMAAADKYSKIAPDAPHALHMPSHIYSMLGAWNRSISSNIASAKSAGEYAAKSGMNGTPAAILHAYDFMEYAYLQLGQYDQAMSLVKASHELEGKPLQGAAPVGYMALAAIPARYYLERRDWVGASQLQVVDNPFAPALAVTHFARAMGECHSGALSGAQEDIKNLAAISDDLRSHGQAYWADQVDVQRKAAGAWCEFATSPRHAQALEAMRAAADQEDSSLKDVAMENRLYPMRELYADMLLADGQSKAALDEYRISLRASPNRLAGLYSEFRAAVAVGNAADIVNAAKRLSALGRQSKVPRPEFSEADQITSRL